MKQVWAQAPDHAVIEERVHALDRHVAAIAQELAALRATVNDLCHVAASSEESVAAAKDTSINAHVQELPEDSSEF